MEVTMKPCMGKKKMHIIQKLFPRDLKLINLTKVWNQAEQEKLYESMELSWARKTKEGKCKRKTPKVYKFISNAI